MRQLLPDDSSNETLDCTMLLAEVVTLLDRKRIPS